MVDRDDFDRLILKAIHETVVPVEDLAEGFVSNLGHDATRVWKQLKSANRCDEPLGQQAGVTLGVSRHIGLDRFDVFRSLAGPDDTGSLEEALLGFFVGQRLPSVGLF